MKKATVTLPNLFAGEMIGGLDPQQWEKLNNHERLLNRLAFIHVRASALYSVPYDATSGLPANMHIESLRLAERTQKAIEALQEGDHSTAAWLTLEVGLNLERIKSVLAVAKALEVSQALLTPRSEGGKSTAQQKKELEAANIEEAKRHWGKLADQTERDRCGIIAKKMGRPTDTVRRWIKKAGLR